MTNATLSYLNIGVIVELANNAFLIFVALEQMSLKTERLYTSTLLFVEILSRKCVTGMYE